MSINRLLKTIMLMGGFAFAGAVLAQAYPNKQKGRGNNWNNDFFLEKGTHDYMFFFLKRFLIK